MAKRVPSPPTAPPAPASPVAPLAPRPSLAARRQAHRQSLAARLARRIRQPLTAAQKDRDPLGPAGLPPGAAYRRQVRVNLAAFALALGLHGAVVMVGLLTGDATLGPPTPKPVEMIRLTETTTPKIAPEPAPLPATPPAATVSPPSASRTPKKSPPPPAADAPAPPPPKAAPPAPPLRVVGLSLDSTTASQAANAPAYAVGTTQMGTTDRTATDPALVASLAAAAGNRAAAFIPGSGPAVRPPARKRNRPPPYPEVLRQRGIEADVVVRVAIDPTGKVTQVTVVQGSGYREFDEAARQAALSEEFEPATRDGTPIAYTLKYTYAFRINP